MVTMTRPIAGNETEAFGSDPSSDTAYRFRYKVLELDDLVTSHKTDLTLNPRYPKELQPRIRDRAASRAQIEGMAQHLNPRVLLHDSGFIDTGPMIVGPDNVVESGNGRSLALMLAAQDSPENYKRYKSMLETLADKYGFTKSQVAQMKQPVLVRERLSDVNRVKFATEANVGAVMGMSPYEQALQDSKKLSAEVVGQLEVGEDQTIDQALRARANDFIVQHFVQNVPANERATIADDKGQINSQGLQRLRLGLFAKTYTGPAGEKLTRIFGESADPYVKQIETAMFSTLPDMAKAGGLVASGSRARDLDVAPDLAEVVDTYASLKAQGLSVQDYLKQSQMFEERLSPFQKQLLEHLDDIGRKSKTLREFFRETAEKIIASPPPGQGSLLGDARLSKEEVLNAIINSQRQELGKPKVAVAASLSRSKALEQADSPRTPGPIGVGSQVGEGKPSTERAVQAGPVLSKGASVQVGLSGIGPSHAQVKMLDEFGTAPGAGGQKQQLIDEEALKAKEEAKPLKGQMGFGGEVVGEEKAKAESISSDPAVLKAEKKVADIRERMSHHRWGETRRFEGRRAGNRLEQLDKAQASLSKARTRAEDKYDWRSRKLTCQLCGKEITTSHPMQTLEAQMVWHLRKEHGDTKEAARMGFRNMMRDQGKVSTAPTVLHGSLSKTAPPENREKVPETKTETRAQAKQPWEMTGIEFYENKDVKIASSLTKSAAGKRAYEYTAKYGDAEVSFVQKSQDINRAAEILHKKFVAKALYEGKRVPAEVLKDYPDLKPLLSKSPMTPEQQVSEGKEEIRTRLAVKKATRLATQFGGKQPWELTLAQFTKWVPVPKRINDRVWRVEMDGTSYAFGSEEEAKRKAPSKFYKQFVREAIDESLPVPAGVLDDYRQLTKPSKGQSFEHAQVHPTVVKLTDSEEDIEANLEKAQLFHKRRKELAQQKDESQSHDRTIKPQNLTTKRLRAWKKRPGGSDIRGVDSKTIGRMR